MKNADYQVLYDTSIKRKAQIMIFMTVIILFGSMIPFAQYDIDEQYPMSYFILFILTAGSSAAYYCWLIFKYQCSKCGQRLFLARDSQRLTITFDCDNCRIIWDTEIFKNNGSNDTFDGL
jgi:hypothetical protein